MYKRQSSQSARWRGSQTGWLRSSLGSSSRRAASGSSRVQGTVASVSYTHLDVYKRQRLLSLVESPSGNVRLRYSQKVYRTACSPELAEIIDGLSLIHI